MPVLNPPTTNNDNSDIDIPNNLHEVESKEEETVLISDNTILVKRKNTGIWVKIYDIFSTLAEVSNVGIVIEILSKWVPALLSIAFFSALAAFTDPLIYLWRGLGSLHRIVGRAAYGIVFEGEEEKNKTMHIVADVIKLCFFALAITLFLGAIASGPLGTFLAWSTALCGLSVSAYFDYHQQMKTAKNTRDELINNENTHPEDLKTAQEDYNSKKYSRNLYITILIGLAFLLICGSAAAFAPPALVPILFIASKVASGFLALVNIGRVANWTRTLRKKPAESNLNPTHDESIQAQPQNSHALINGALSRRGSFSGLIIDLPEPKAVLAQPDSASPTPLDESLAVININEVAANQRRSQSAPSMPANDPANIEPAAAFRF